MSNKANEAVLLHVQNTEHSELSTGLRGTVREANDDTTASAQTSHQSFPDTLHNSAGQYRIIVEIKNALRNADTEVTDLETVLINAKLSTEKVLEHFENMHAVVIALVESLALELAAPLETAVYNLQFHLALLNFTSRIADHLWQLKALYRIALTEAIRYEDRGADFYHRGPGLLTAKLANLIEAYQAIGAVRSEDSYVLASQFMALARMHLDKDRPISAVGKIDSLSIVDIFCSGIMTGDKSCAK
ncbi:TetR/AcrR family transcriptional regulator C-terminal domain-containing protein [Pseudomonas fluorescens]|uniref:TetR/AcrR family transcriptional regulator C-terminal domain-containing protein n=1 Tax=Pseudomonas fluorescens TaxID=294 RepID=UPI003525CEE2